MLQLPDSDYKTDCRSNSPSCYTTASLLRQGQDLPPSLQMREWPSSKSNIPCPSLYAIVIPDGQWFRRPVLAVRIGYCPFRELHGNHGMNSGDTSEVRIEGMAMLLRLAWYGGVSGTPIGGGLHRKETGQSNIYPPPRIELTTGFVDLIHYIRPVCHRLAPFLPLDWQQRSSSMPCM